MLMTQPLGNFAISCDSAGMWWCIASNCARKSRIFCIAKFSYCGTCRCLTAVHETTKMVKVLSSNLHFLAP